MLMLSLHSAIKVHSVINSMEFITQNWEEKVTICRNNHIPDIPTKSDESNRLKTRIKFQWI